MIGRMPLDDWIKKTRNNLVNPDFIALSFLEIVVTDFIKFNCYILLSIRTNYCQKINFFLNEIPNKLYIICMDYYCYTGK